MTCGARRTHTLDRWARRSAGGRLLVGGAPGRMIRLSATGAATLDRLLAGQADERDGNAATRLRDRLLAAGLIHPVPAPSEAALTTIVPVRDGGPALARLVAGLTADGEVIVVDDRSRDGSAAAAATAGARVIENPGPSGPAAARNAGLAAATTEYVAFVDADCATAPGWSAALAGLLDGEPRLALVAPRVRSAPGPSAIARYETAYSPLDLGGDPSVVGPGRRVGYLPSAALVARRSALLAVDGFEERLTVGEDVDLVWRLLAAGWSARYAPSVEVLHRPRPTMRSLARQRYAYGRSAATLQRLHPGAASPLRASRGIVAVWLAALAGPRAAALVLAAVTARAARGGRDRDARRALAAAVLRGELESARQLARACARDWLPLTAALAIGSTRGRRVLTLAIATDAIGGRRPNADPPPLAVALALRALDNASYAAGLWRGAIVERSLTALTPVTP